MSVADLGVDKMTQAFQVLVVKFNVIVTRTLKIKEEWLW